jgi:hypothetical protein
MRRKPSLTSGLKLELIQNLRLARYKDVHITRVSGVL